MQACTGEEVLYIVYLGLYASHETRKGIRQSCTGGDVLNYLHPLLRP